MSWLLLFLVNILATSESGAVLYNFTYNGFKGANLSVDGTAEITTNGLLRLTNTSNQQMGHAFYSTPLLFKNSTTGSVFSFSTTFVIAIATMNSVTSGVGLAFFLSPTTQLSNPSQGRYMGLFNSSSDGNSSTHIFAIEFDTVFSPNFRDIDGNHVGINNNSLTSINSSSAGYYSPISNRFQNLSLSGGEPIQVWVDYSGPEKLIQVTISPVNVPRPNRPLLSMNMDLSDTILDSMHMGFSASTAVLMSAHYVLGWSFKMNGQAQPLDLSSLPMLPRIESESSSKLVIIVVPTVIGLLAVVIFFSVVFIVRRKIKYAQVLEDWERGYGTHRFSYKDLYTATAGFRDKELLGEGGFGKVYRGMIARSNIQVAVKRVSQKSNQGLREFVAEIVSLGQLRHRNLVQLFGYCRRQGELLLVYEFMPNGSLDNYIFDQHQRTLNWKQRFRIIKGVASALLYLHEEWEQVVLHRDIKSSNVLLDSEFNGRLGDFGLARLYNHGTNPTTTHLVGTLGYIAPEFTQTGKATTSTDVFAFGVFLLEVACGRRPITEVILAKWVWECWQRGEIVNARDVKLGGEYVKEEIELVLKLGLLCAHPVAAARPGMKQVMQHLEGDCDVPDISSSKWRALRQRDEHGMLPQEMGSSNVPTTSSKLSLESSSTSFVESLLSGGR